MLEVQAADVRVFLHVLAATVWVGGQQLLAALVPVLGQVSAGRTVSWSCRSASADPPADGRVQR